MSTAAVSRRSFVSSSIVLSTNTTNRPATTKALIDSGKFEVHVEKSPQNPDRKRIYDDSEFEKVGATLVEDQSWPKAPTDHIIIGLKELEEEEFPLKHTHVQFAHCYKGQAGWDSVLSRFPRGGGTLLDLEFLQDEKKRRVAAFGFHAGFAGSALALKTWAWQLENGDKPLPSVATFTDGRGYYENEDQMLEQLREDLQKGIKKAGKTPTVLVMGALGRCGRGAVDLFIKAGLPESNITKWDIQETTAKPGPYAEIIESDIFVNCIYLSDPIPPFLNVETLSQPSRNLSVICDVSCDTTNPHNPIPVYSVNTLFTSPTVPVELPKSDGPPLSVISIDHLPSLLPRESSEAFSNDLLPYLMQLDNWRSPDAPVWGRAETLFKEKVATLPAGMADKAANGH
ncbi:Formate/glycerate dehydrogenase catalytic domain-like protein [Tothia fuscella]|uniref:Saccharopine dehydrogenase [NAD(+), L-lysine-forming] n=1 Tax=Tothia fuscella TaxID=1048955 RepID=A0A9P4TR83_9PEZI|nr:Formate/glycerate dehydrogenase catalytic domain-like protein [Tothia fuscella]